MLIFIIIVTLFFIIILGDALNGALSDNSINGDQSIQPTEPSRQLLIDRIIKLQESNARKAEKLDFFEEHTRILVEELQKKKKIIQTYILHENIGAMGGNERDKYKVNFIFRLLNLIDAVELHLYKRNFSSA